MARVTWGFTASLDGFITGPNHDMSWMSGLGSLADGTVEDLASQVAVIISGRRGYDAAKAQAAERDELTSEAYGGAWEGTEFILTHRPEELAEDTTITAVNCSIAEVVDRARAIAGDRDIQIISADIGRQALEVDLIDEMQVFVAPIFLGDGTRVFDVPGGRRVYWELAEADEANMGAWFRRFRPRRQQDLTP
ncbi:MULTISPECIES: dihydrofolate reductase family protein [Brevibacterium]|uniref:Dihydrofolate reductase n=1 Tax=Brevibacterium aurantiacum TaxID=273384 RepID=A0A2A3YRG8_BREAU|nr:MULTISPECIES: dihydrofolate reductase family protein [Brevibacterium]MDN5593905.1 dihydrofolate reductase family protein [Brevibacterium sp.]AZL04837.1 dihydrofolate reductase [Brevibacterium aurantiacum]AZL12035.1 dihydrofolate reductase [Brevibacterium aurantiacum]MDN5607312.1 dihydrofolate reductase family protein [Brevibacterium sp.]MDN5662106.1 dihydrofolate reductase family protein [Brevibacterium aurantiacum]